MSERWTEREVDWSIKDVGAPLLDSLASSLYSKLEVFREYVQNAIDAYVDFQQLTGLAPRNMVQVGIDKMNAAVHIRDYGVGMDWNDLQTAKSIAVTTKLGRFNEFVGFRGIGIWSGLSVCDQLDLVTTKVGVAREFRLVIDCKGIVEHFHEPIPIDELLRGRVQIFERSAEADKHHTHVKLANVHREYADLLDVDAVTRYAEQHLPVPFDPGWKTLTTDYTQTVGELLDGVDFTTTYELTINDQPIYRRFPSPSDLKKPERQIIVDAEGREVAVAWFCQTARRGSGSRGRGPKAIDKKVGIRNFAIRVKNFALGDRGLYSNHPEVADPSLLDWYVGEIYVTDPDIRPDTKRASFQPSAHHDVAVAAIRHFYSVRSWHARGWSAQLAAEDKCKRALQLTERIQNVLDGSSPGANNADSVEQCWAELREIKQKLQEIRTKATAVDGQEAESTRIERSYLRRQEVKRALDSAFAKIDAVEQRLSQDAITTTASTLNPLGNATPEEDQKRNTQKRQRRSKAITAGLAANPISATAALGTVAAIGAVGEEPKQLTLGQMPLSDNGQFQSGSIAADETYELDTVIEAFRATVAAVVGENSEVFRQIMERLPDELQWRGINA